MQSPISDIPQPTSPRSSAPNSPNNNNNATKSMNMTDSKFHKFESIRLERPQPTKFDGILLARFQQEHDDNDLKNHPLIYPKDAVELEANAKFSIERLKQLTGHAAINNRLSPSEDSNQSSKYSHETKYNLSPNKGVEMDLNLHQMNQNTSHVGVKFAAAAAAVAAATTTIGNVNDIVDLERFKLARTLSNGKELSDFGFRIQLSGLNTNYARSDTSEELVVDGNDDASSQGGGGTATVCIYFDKYDFLFSWLEM